MTHRFCQLFLEDHLASWGLQRLHFFNPNDGNGSKASTRFCPWKKKRALVSQRPFQFRVCLLRPLPGETPVSKSIASEVALRAH